MKLLNRILNRIAFVRAEFTPDGQCRTSVHILHRGTLTDAGWKQAKGVLTVAVICGSGVVTKPDDAEISARVRADDETFLWSSANGQTSFVRRERLQGLQAELAEHKIVPGRICCAGAETDFSAAATIYAAQVYDTLRWKTLIRPTDADSAAAQALVRRLALPVLGVFLFLLLGNMLLSARLNARRGLLQTELTARERTASESKSVGTRQRELLAEFAARPTIPRAVVCDRIARAVPERIRLTALEIEPLTKRFEAGKPLQRRERTAVVCGTASASADISLFTGRLAELTCCNDVRLTNVEKERDGDRLGFRIEMGL